MGKYNLGEVWWTQFPFQEIDVSKRRPAIVIDENTIVVLAMMVTSKDKKNPYSIKIDDWVDAGLARESWARIDRVVSMDEWRMEKKIGDLSKRDLLKITQLLAEHLSGTYHEFSLLAITNPKMSICRFMMKDGSAGCFHTIGQKTLIRKMLINMRVSCLI